MYSVGTHWDGLGCFNTFRPLPLVQLRTQPSFTFFFGSLVNFSLRHDQKHRYQDNMSRLLVIFTADHFCATSGFCRVALNSSKDLKYCKLYFLFLKGQFKISC